MQLLPPIVSQARHYIEVAGLDPDTEILLLKGYGLLREKRFPVPAGREDAARMIYSLYDQELFAFVLLLTGRNTEFDRFTSQFPAIFDVKKT